MKLRDEDATIPSVDDGLVYTVVSITKDRQADLVPDAEAIGRYSPTAMTLLFSGRPGTKVGEKFLLKRYDDQPAPEEVFAVRVAERVVNGYMKLAYGARCVRACVRVLRRRRAA